MIAIQNVYYMLSYAFQVLNEQGYKNIATEDFDNTAELCAAILSRGIAVQIKRSLGREYIPVTESRAALRGKLEISDSIKSRTILKKQMVCTFDEFSVNSYMNQIIKSTVMLLLRSDISKARKKELRKLMVYFDDVDTLDAHHINWDIQYNRNNQTYRMLISVYGHVHEHRPVNLRQIRFQRHGIFGAEHKGIHIFHPDPGHFLWIKRIAHVKKTGTKPVHKPF